MNPDADTIHNAIIDCLLTEEEICSYPEEDLVKIRNGDPSPELLAKYDLVLIPAVMLNTALRKGRLEKYRPMVTDCIKNVDPVFCHMGGSFLMLCMRKDGSQWGEHRNCDELLALSMGLGMCEFPVPRGLWGALPGDVPIIKFKLPREAKCKTT